MKKALLFLLIFIVNGITTFVVFGLRVPEVSYPDIITNKVYSEGIHTVLLGSDTWELAAPVIEAGSSQRLELHFDDFSGSIRTFGYTLVHCDATWHPSDLSNQTYLSGYGYGMIRESFTSTNTQRDYIHYRLTFPEEDCMPVISGNYALVVYNDADPSQLILSRKFYITEKLVQITAQVKQPTAGSLLETGQQLDFSLQFDPNLIRDPLNDLATVIRQNNRDDNALILQKPSFMQTGRMDYSSPGEGIFAGGNEFRSLDIKSMKYQTENIAAIDFRNPYYHVLMKPDESRGNKPYFSKPDINGGYIVEREKSGDKHTEADYIYVHFRFAPPAGYAGENVYVTGGFCDWAIQGRNELSYNPDIKCFEAILLLKQGWYDYCYAVEDPQMGKLNVTQFEGSFYETGNDYDIYVYFHDRRGRCDRLIGYLPVKRN
jgi:hypothetical protein